MNAFVFLTKRGKTITGLSVIYLILQIQDFRWGLNNGFIYALVKFSVFIALFVLIAGIRSSGWFRVSYVLIYLACVTISYRLNLWRISANAYLSDYQPLFTQVAESPALKSKPTVSLSKNHFDRDTLLSKREQEQLKLLFQNTSVIEIEATSNGVLFIFSRFIDNGYGFLYITNPDILSTVRPTVAYDLTSWVQLDQNWYYVSFT